MEAFLRPAEAVGSGPGGWHCPLISSPLGFLSLRAGYQATALEGSTLAWGWHRLLMREEAEARPAEARVTVGKPRAPRKGGGTASALQPQILLLLS